MKSLRTPILMLLAIVATLLFLSLVTSWQDAGAQIEDVSDYTGLKVKATALATATPLVELWRGSTGQTLIIRDTGGTPEAWANSDGSMTINSLASGASGVDLNGYDLVIDADADTILGQTGSTDDAADITLGAGTGTFSVLTGNLKVGNGSPTVAQDGEDAYFEGQVEIDGEAQLDGALDANSTADFASSVTVTGAAALNGGIAADGTAFTVADTSGNTQIAGTLGVTGATTLTGNTDVAGTLQYGAADLYPLGYGSVNQQVVCGTTATFTETLQVTPTGLTTVTYVIASQITTPAAGAVFLTVSDPTTSTFDLYSWESDYSAGTTGITAHYCAIGDQ